MISSWLGGLRRMSAVSVRVVIMLVSEFGMVVGREFMSVRRIDGDERDEM